MSILLLHLIETQRGTIIQHSSYDIQCSYVLNRRVEIISSSQKSETTYQILYGVQDRSMLVKMNQEQNQKQPENQPQKINQKQLQKHNKNKIKKTKNKPKFFLKNLFKIAKIKFRNSS